METVMARLVGANAPREMKSFFFSPSPQRCASRGWRIKANEERQSVGGGRVRRVEVRKGAFFLSFFSEQLPNLFRRRLYSESQRRFKLYCKVPKASKINRFHHHFCFCFVFQNDFYKLSLILGDKYKFILLIKVKSKIKYI